jgi:chromosome segregation ATPase
MVRLTVGTRCGGQHSSFDPFSAPGQKKVILASSIAQDPIYIELALSVEMSASQKDEGSVVGEEAETKTSNPLTDDLEDEQEDGEYLQFRDEMSKVLVDISQQGDFMGDFNEEFEKLMKSMMTSHENEMRVDRKCRKLSLEISKAKKESKTNEDEVGELGRQKLRLTDDIERVWTSIKETHTKLTKKQKDLNERKIEVEKATAKGALGAGWTDEQRKEFQNLQRHEREAEAQLENSTQRLTGMQKAVVELMEELQQTDQSRADTEMEIKKIQAQLMIVEEETNQAHSDLNKINLGMKDVRDEIKLGATEEETKLKQIETGEKEIGSLEEKLRTAKVKMEGYLEQYDRLYKNSQAMTRQLDQQVHKNAAIEKDTEQVRQELLLHNQELQGATKQQKGLRKLIQAAAERENKVDAALTKAAKDKLQLSEQLESTTNDKVSERKIVEGLRQQGKNIERERDILNRDGITAEERIVKLGLMMKVNANAKKNLENEISGFIAQARQHREIIERMELDVLKYTKEGKEANEAYYAALEEVKYNEVKITELQRKTVDCETRLKQLQNLYEQVRSERNLHSKNLIEAQDDITEMKRKFKMMNHDINQMKEEITQKDHALVKEHFDHHKVEKQKVKIKTDLSKVRKQIDSSDQIILNQKDEVQKLGRIIQEAEEERQRQKKELASVVGERDILTSQLVRRGEELSAVYEKIKIQRAALAQGENAYNKIIGERETFKDSLRKLLEMLMSLQTDTSSVPDLKMTKMRLEQDLLNERAKCQALRDEMTKPINVHRWRKLQDSEPEQFEKIQKLHLLQKQIILKTEEVVEKDLLIQEKERLYVELKNILARQPGPEVAEQLQVYSKNLKEKKRQMKAMQGELEMYKAQVDEYKFDLERLNDRFSTMQQEYFDVMNHKTEAGMPADKRSEDDDQFDPIGDAS